MIPQKAEKQKEKACNQSNLVFLEWNELFYAIFPFKRLMAEAQILDFKSIKKAAAKMLPAGALERFYPKCNSIEAKLK